MKIFPHISRRRSNIEITIAAAAIAVATNVLLSFFMDKIGLPIHIDTFGTIVMAALGGAFPGILTAVSTNILCSFFNAEASYFSLISVLIAIFVTWFIKKHSLKKPKDAVIFFLITGTVSGILSALIQWWLFGGPQYETVTGIVETLEDSTNISGFVIFLIINVLLNIVDKGITTGLAALLLVFIPEKKQEAVKRAGYKQSSVSDELLTEVRTKTKGVRFSLQAEMFVLITGVTLVLLAVIGWVGVQLYFEHEKELKTENAYNAAKFVSTIVDTDMIGEYITGGYDTPGYKETEDTMYMIRDAASSVEYLYVVKIEKEGCRFVFDLVGKDGAEAFSPGELVEFDQAFIPYLPALSEGDLIENIESDDKWGRVITVYVPIKDQNNNTICYAGADVSVTYLERNVRDFIMKILLIFTGVYILIIAYAMWTTGVNTSYPISAMADCVAHYAGAQDDQSKLDENVRMIRSLDIQTGNEVEKLYNAICKMTLDQANQVRDVRRLSESTAKMQDGLIITMADMVESRDSDTGAHVQKTSAYVKIIAEGLMKKGYYPEKISPKFISDIVRSAPLHDVGKINIPDGVLNKPGRLTDEEFEIMKTHTTAGGAIIEKAINTVKGGSYLKEARNMAMYHHERWDGKGYPEGLHGEVIPLSARIMAVADVFDALTSPRVYKPAFSLDKALSIIKEGSGTQFDERCVDVFLESLPEVKVILRKYNGEVLE